MSPRAWRAADLAAMAAIHASRMAEKWTAESLASMLATPGCFAWVVEEKSVIAGFAIARVAGGEAEILTIAVRSESVRRGHGAALMRKLAAQAREMGAETLFLEVNEANEPAQALYKNLGFVVAGRRKNYYCEPGKAPSDALILKALLPLL
jgi:ribosomal-protein-alanine N-acetyltransferase